MKNLIIIFILLLSPHLFAQTGSEVKDKLGDLIKKLDALPEILKGKVCNPALHIDRTIHPVTIQNIDGEKFQISDVSEDYINELFKYLAGQKQIPFKYPEDGCYARAHEMARLMEEKGVISAKTFIEGKLRVETKNSPKGYVEWWYHVAPILSVRGKDGSQKLYVIDPSIFDKPVPVEEWYHIQTKHSAGRTDRTYLTPRFNYTPEDSNLMLNGYRKSDWDNVRNTMAKYLKIQEKRSGLGPSDSYINP